MKKKTIVTVILTVVVVLSATVLGVANVFRVDGVVLDAPVVSEAAKGEAEALQKELEERYAGASTLFAGEEAALEILEKYPYFRLTSFKKSFPNLLVIEATEDAEVYAVESGENYYILSGSGTVLGVRSAPTNRADGADNVVIRGVNVSGELGEKISGEDGIASILTLTARLSEAFGGIRSNLVSVTVERHGSVDQLTLQMREGVTVYVIKPESFTVSKAEKIANVYLSLSDRERLTGSIVATDDGKDAIVSYSAKDFE